MALDATTGGANANSYATREEADAYFADRPYASKWTGAPPADRDKALIAATDRLDRETYHGLPSGGAQRLQWPRTGAPDRSGYYYGHEVVPECVKEAAYLLALEIASSNVMSESKLHNFDEIKIGPLNIKPRQPQQSGRLPSSVVRLITHVLLSQPNTVRLLRG